MPSPSLDLKDIRLREANPADAAAIAAIYNESVDVGDATADDQRRTAAEFRQRVRLLDAREAMLVLERGAEVIGWGSIKRYSDRGGYRYACETSVYLRRAETRRGYGTFLKEAVLSRCRALGYRHVVARVFADNQTSLAYNQRLGYELVGVQRQIVWKDGRWMDVAIMQLVLGDGPPGEGGD